MPAYVEAVLVVDVEPERLDSIVDGRDLGHGGGMDFLIPRLSRGPLPVAHIGFGGARLGHAT